MRLYINAESDKDNLVKRFFITESMQIFRLGKLARTFVCSGHCLWPHSGQKRAETGILLLELGQIFNTGLLRRNAPQKLQ